MSTEDDTDHAAAQMGRVNGRSARNKPAVAGRYADTNSDDDEEDDGRNQKKPAKEKNDSDHEDYDDDDGGTKPSALRDANDADEYAVQLARYLEKDSEKLKKRLKTLGLKAAGSHEERAHRLVQYDDYNRVKIAMLREEAKDRDLKLKVWNDKDVLIAALIADDENKTKLMSDPHPAFAAGRPEEPEPLRGLMEAMQVSDLSKHGLKEIVDPEEVVGVAGDIGPKKEYYPANDSSAACLARRSFIAHRARNPLGIVVGGTAGAGVAGAVQHINQHVEKTEMVKAGIHGYNSAKREGEETRPFTDSNCITCLLCNKNMFITDCERGAAKYAHWHSHVKSLEHKNAVKMGFKRPTSDSEYLRKCVQHLKKKEADTTRAQKSFLKKHIFVPAGELERLEYECTSCDSMYKASQATKIQFGTARGIILRHLKNKHNININ